MSWPVVKVKSVCQQVRGVSYKKDQVSDTPKDGYEKLYRSNNISPEGHLNEYKLIYVDASCVKEKQLLKIYDILITASTGSKSAIGKNAQLLDDIKVTFGAFCKVLRPNQDLIDPLYLGYFFKRQEFRAYISNVVEGANINNLKNEHIDELDIPLPPLPVQKQIAAVLEKADTLRSQCQQMEQELNSLAQSVFLDMFGDPVANPKGFELAPLGSLSDVQIGPFGTMLHKSDYVSGGIPLINPTHITKSSIVPSDDLTITISKYNDLPQYHLKEGDIIMGRRGEMGRCAIVSGSSVGYFCGTGSLFIRPDQTRVKPQYLNDFLSSLPVKRWFEEQSLGVTMANLNKGIVSGVMIPLPSIDLQVRYEEVLKNISERLQNYSNLKDEIEDNFNSLMQRAFKGELDLKDVA